MAHLANRVIFRSIFRAWVSIAARPLRTAPRPTDAPLVHRSGPNALRLLLVGDGIVVGYGAVSHELGFGGALAGRVATATDRGVDLQIVTGDRISVETIFERLGLLALARFDGVVLSIGFNAALTQRDESSWAAKLRRVLRQLESSGVPAFVIGIPTTIDDRNAPAMLQRWVRARADQLSAVIEAECARTAGVAFLPLVPLRGRQFLAVPAREDYEDWAGQIAPAIATALVSSVRWDVAQNEPARQHALEESDILDTASEPRFERVVDAVRAAFRVSGAAITFIDTERQWIKAATGIDRADTPRITAFCDLTIRGTGLLVVEDTLLDPRFAHFPQVVEPDGVRFYAGYPLETPDGFRIGALCIVDTEAHEFTADDSALLRDFAMEAQRQLWGEWTEPGRN